MKQIPNDNYTKINEKWIFEQDAVDGIKIHKCLNAYLVYVTMLRSPENSRSYGEKYEFTISFPTLDSLLAFLFAVFDDKDVGSSMVTEKFRGFINAMIPSGQNG